MKEEVTIFGNVNCSTCQNSLHGCKKSETKIQTRTQPFHFNLIINFPYCPTYNSDDVSLENLVLDQLIPLAIIYFILEVLTWSLVGVKELTDFFAVV